MNAASASVSRVLIAGAFLSAFVALGQTPALVQSNAGQGTSVSSLPVSFSSGNTVGNLIVASVRLATTTQTVTIADTLGNTYANAVSQAQSTDGHQIFIFYAKNIKAGANTVTATFSASNPHAWLAVYEYSGLGNTTALDRTAHASGSSTAPSSGSTSTTTVANELVFGACGLPYNYAGTVSAGSGYALLQQNTSTSRAANEGRSVTATGAYAGTFSLSATANWSAAVATFATAPAVTTSSLAAGTQGATYSATLAASGGKTSYTWSITAGTLPAGLSLNAGSGVISGTPTAAGTSNITVQVKDANNNTGTKALSITINPPPSITTTSPLPGGTQNAAYSRTLAATGGTTPLTWSITSGTLPTGLSLNASSGVISGTPTGTGTSTPTVGLKDSNNVAATAKQLSITINAPPSITTTSPLPGGTQNAAYSTTLAATGGTTPLTWSITSGTLPTGLSLNASSGVISGTPTGTGTSTPTVGLKDSNNVAATAKQLSITINAPLSITTSSLPTGTIGVPYSAALAASGGATPYTWSLSQGALPAGLSLNASSGAITGTPTANGTSSFTVQVTDANSVMKTKALSITIAPPAASPTFNPVAGTYTSPQPVTLHSTTSGATIRYTLDGTDPSHTSGSVYNGAITLTANTTIKAIAYKSGMADSPIVLAAYTILQPVAAPTFSPPPGTYTTPQVITISSATPGAFIRYTTDSSTPTATAGNPYVWPIGVVNSTLSYTVVSAIAYKPGLADSQVSTAQYQISPPANGMTVSPQQVMVMPGQQVTLIATIPGSSQPPVAWSTNPPELGTFTATELGSYMTYYQAPATITPDAFAPDQTFQIVATNPSDPTVFATVQVFLTPHHRFNAGGDWFVDPVGNVWSAGEGVVFDCEQNMYYHCGASYLDSYPEPYRTATTGNSFWYGYRLPSATYDVSLRFAGQNVGAKIYADDGTELDYRTAISFPFDKELTVDGGVDFYFKGSGDAYTGFYPASIAGIESKRTDTVEVAPLRAPLGPLQSQQFSATGGPVTWSISPPGAGMIDGTGLYSALASPPVQVAVITATSVADPNKAASAQVYLQSQPVPYSVTGVSPTAGPVGTVVTITGACFGQQGSSSITFNGTPSLPTSWSDTNIVVPVPSGATTGPLTVIIAGITTAGPIFTVTAPPEITSLSPTFGPVGTSVTISGTSLSMFAPAGASVTIAGTSLWVPQYPSKGAATVTFDGVAATPTSWGPQTIIVPVPPGASSGPVVVTLGVASNSRDFTVAPSIGNISPTVGAGGTSVTIAGSGFGASQGSSGVTFNGIPAIPSSWSDTSIVVPAPPAVTTGPVVVLVAGASSNGSVFTVPPAISTLSPTAGVPGTVVTVMGSNFGLASQGGTISFGGISATPTSWGPGRIVVPVPAGAATAPVVVTVAGQPSYGVLFTVGTGSIGGAITRASDGSAISAAAIQALQANAVQDSTTSAPDGSYNISNLAPGTYDLKASAAGYGTTVLTGNTVAVNGTTTVNVPLGTAGSISGTVTESDGVTPISGATVTASQGGDTAGSASTDASGAYTISALGAGSYWVQAAASGYTPQNQAGVSVTAGGPVTVNFSLAGQSVITYGYDELGRLVTVTDSLKGSATYTYDAVGNILSISRTDPAPHGKVGSDLRSRVTSQAGSSQAASSAAPRVAAVGAPSAAVSSSATKAASRAPAITGFSPLIANVGDAVTITGSNFDVPVNDKVRLNNGLATVTSAAATRITTSVPAGASSGRISLATPMGRTVSSADFFVLPAGYLPGGVAFSGRMTIGSELTRTLGGTQIGLVVFDGTAGQKVTLQASGAALKGTKVLIEKPNGALLTEVDVGQNREGVAQAILPVTGTYTVMVAGNGGSAGGVTLRLAASAAGAGAQ